MKESQNITYKKHMKYPNSYGTKHVSGCAWNFSSFKKKSYDIYVEGWTNDSKLTHTSKHVDF